MPPSISPSLLAGVAAATAGCGPDGYVLTLDDDVALHPGTIGRLVDELEGDPAAFMATG
jgi:GT2 family glycosyltransferase